MARRLVTTTDDTLFGDTEFALRDQALGLVADAYAEQNASTETDALGFDERLGLLVDRELAEVRLPLRLLRGSASRAVAVAPLDQLDRQDQGDRKGELGEA